MISDFPFPLSALNGTRVRPESPLFFNELKNVPSTTKPLNPELLFPLEDTSRYRLGSFARSFERVDLPATSPRFEIVLFGRRTVEISDIQRWS